MLHQTGFDRRLLNNFLQQKYVGQEQTEREIESENESNGQCEESDIERMPEDGLVEACQSLEDIHQT